MESHSSSKQKKSDVKEDHVITQVEKISADDLKDQLEPCQQTLTDRIPNGGERSDVPVEKKEQDQSSDKRYDEASAERGLVPETDHFTLGVLQWPDENKTNGDPSNASETFFETLKSDSSEDLDEATNDCKAPAELSHLSTSPQPDGQDPTVAAPPPSDPSEPSAAAPSPPAADSGPASDVSETLVLEAGSVPRHVTPAQLREAIDRVQQLDQNLEKKFREHMEARAVTADLQALVRRELADLSCRGGRRESREEADNTMRFIKALSDNDGDSETTSSRVTPFFQTQVRFRGGRGAAPADSETTESASGRPPPPPPPSHVTTAAAAGESGTLSRQPHYEQDFIRRNIELAQEAGGALAMTEDERDRLEQLLAEDEQTMENAFSMDASIREQLHSLDDQLSSLGVGGSALQTSQPGDSEIREDGEPRPADGPPDEPDHYLEMTRLQRETTERLDALNRRLRQLSEPVTVRRLERGDVDSMLHETIASLVSVPRGSVASHSCTTVHCAGSQLDSEAGAASHQEADGAEGPDGEHAGESGEIGSEAGLDSIEPDAAASEAGAPASEADAADSEADTPPSEADAAASEADASRSEADSAGSEADSAESDEAETDAGGAEEPRSVGEEAAARAAEPAPVGWPARAAASESLLSEARSERTVDLRSVLSGRLAHNEQQLARELRPGSPTAWLVDVEQGEQRFQMVVPRLSRSVLDSLLEGVTVPEPEEPHLPGDRASPAVSEPAAAC